MNNQLTEQDSQAVDLLLDRDSDPNLPTPSTTAVLKRIQAVERLLHLLDQLPAPNPPPGLVLRTLARVSHLPLPVLRTLNPRAGNGIIGTRPMA